MGHLDAQSNINVYPLWVRPPSGMDHITLTIQGVSEMYLVKAVLDDLKRMKEQMGVR